ncbi:MAG: M48 family metalloprotease [Pirellulaceae bacterium]|nr:M48 family metalloprotease [Pirellulaceae bacterium]
MNLPGPQLAWIGTACVLILGPCVIVGLTAAAARLTHSAVWQRTLWQVALLGILLLAAAEISGTAAGGVRWLRPDSRPQAPEVLGTTSPWERGDRPTWTGLWETEIHAGGVNWDSRWMARTDRSDPTDRSDSVYPADPTDRLASRPSPDRDALGPRPDWGWLLATAWLAGTAGLLLRLAVGRWRLGRFCRNQVSAADPAIQHRVRRLALRLGVARGVRVGQSQRLASPITCGWFRPVIVIPPTLGDEFNPAELDAMLAHEVAHVAAGDTAWQWLADLTAAGLWWHPLVWWARRRWRVAGEMAADEACRIVPQGQDLLAACLVRLARQLEARPWFSSLAMADPGLRSVLGRRVERLLNPPAKITPDAHRISRRFVMATVPVAWLVLAVFCTAWAHAQVPLDQGATTMKVFVLSWRQSLAAAALAAVLSPAASDTLSATAAEGQPETPAAKAEREGEPKREREAPKPEAREGREGERREGPREGDRPAVRREGEGDRREAPSPELMHKRRQLEEQAADIRRKLGGAGRRHPPQAGNVASRTGCGRARVARRVVSDRSRTARDSAPARGGRSRAADAPPGRAQGGHATGARSRQSRGSRAFGTRRPRGAAAAGRTTWRPAASGG